MLEVCTVYSLRDLTRLSSIFCVHLVVLIGEIIMHSKLKTPIMFKLFLVYKSCWNKSCFQTSV